ncbi:MAG: universal stress protein [Proteobacteria bacterium]|nr:universal stress protein [Pseudomonadota bacterium]NIS70219.1 universal stress protein [Pseudomonadota bacterium]
MIKKILVPIDGSDHSRKALEYASDIASKYKAIVHLLHVVAPLPSIPYEDVIEEMREGQERFAKEILDEAVREIKKKGITNFQSTMLHGDPAHGIVDFAKRNDIDMILMGSRGAGGLESLLLGSVSQRVCHLADCTCVTVK